MNVSEYNTFSLGTIEVPKSCKISIISFPSIHVAALINVHLVYNNVDHEISITVNPRMELSYTRIGLVQQSSSEGTRGPYRYLILFDLFLSSTLELLL